MFKVYTTQEFDKIFEKLDNSVKVQIGKGIDQIAENPYMGKPLGYEFFREKKFRDLRVYYLIYEEYVIVFVISMSDKDTQSKAITKIKRLIPFYKEEIKKIIK